MYPPTTDIQAIEQNAINYLASISDIIFPVIVLIMTTYFVMAFIHLLKTAIRPDKEYTVVTIPDPKPSPFYPIKLYVMRWIDHLFIKYYVLKSTRRNSKWK